MCDGNQIIIHVVRTKDEFLREIRKPPQSGRMPLLLSDHEISSSYLRYEWIDRSQISIELGSNSLKTTGCVVGDCNDSTGNIAEHYAALLVRPFLSLSGIDALTENARNNFCGNEVTSFTIFIPSVINDGFSWKKETERKLLNETHGPLFIGYILFMEEEAICKYLFKIILNLVNNGQRDGIDASPKIISSRTFQSISAESIKNLTKSGNPIFILSHSRPTCNRLRFPDKSLSICAAHNKGEDGKCFSGVSCNLMQNDKVSISEIGAQFMFFNGCSTAQIANSGYGIPSKATLAYSAISGKIVNYIGNSHLTRCDDEDIDWMCAFLYLKIKPSNAVKLINELRISEDRQKENTCILLGDAESDSGGIDFPITIVRREYSKKIYFEWNDKNKLLCLITNGDTLCRMSENDLLSIVYTRSNRHILYGNVLFDEMNDRSLLLLKKDEGIENETPIIFHISTKRSPANRDVGLRLEFFIKQARIYSESSPYSDLKMEMNLAEVQNKLVNYRRTSKNLSNRAFLYIGLERRRFEEQRTLKEINQMLISKSLSLGSERVWSWGEQYIANFYFDQTDGYNSEKRCPLCRGIVETQALTSYLDKEIKRITSICTYCSTSKDLPMCGFECDFVSPEPQCKGKTLSDMIYLSNESNHDISISFSLAIANPIVQFESDQVSMTLIKHRPTLTSSSLSFQVKPAGVYEIRLYVAVNGIFGYISRYFIFK